MSFNPITICTEKLVLSKTAYDVFQDVSVYLNIATYSTFGISKIDKAFPIDVIDLESSNITKTTMNAFITKMIKYILSNTDTNLSVGLCITAGKTAINFTLISSRKRTLAILPSTYFIKHKIKRLMNWYHVNTSTILSPTGIILMLAPVPS